MAIKSILEVDVQDEKFRSFQAQFDRYQEALKAMPGAWGEVAKGTGGAAGAFDVMAKKMQAQAVASRLNALAAAKAAELMRKADYDALSRLDKLRKGTESWGAAVGKVADRWKAVAVHSAKSGANLASATVSLLKWTSALGVASALIGGAGGLFGIDRLAASAAAARRQSMVTGVPMGRQRAFDTDFGRFGDTEAITGNVATAKSDFTSPQFLGLRGAGISADAIRHKDAADLGVELFDRLPQIFRKGADDPLLGSKADALGVTNVISLDTVKAYLRATPEERRAQRDAYGRDQVAFGADGGTLRAWQDLTTQLERAKTSIEATFITGLVPLAGPIGDASKAFTDLAAAFLKSDAVKTGIEGLASGMEEAAKYVSTPEFKDDVKSFADGIGVLAGKVKTALEWLGVIPTKAGSNPSQPQGEHDPGGDVAAGTVGGSGPGNGGIGASLRNRRGSHRQDTNFDKIHTRVGAFKATSASQQANAFAITDELRKAGLPDEGIAASLGSAQTESGLNPAVPENSYNHGHHGLWQWDSTRWPKVAAWIRSQGGDPMDARWQTRAHIAEGRAQPGDPIYDSPQTSEGFHKLETSKGNLGRAVEGMRGIERFGQGEEGGRAANAGQWLGHLPTEPTAVAKFDGLGTLSGDISGQAAYRHGQLDAVKGLIFHHTGGRGTPEGVVQTLNQRGLGVQFVMDRDGKIVRTLPEGARGAHILRSEINDLNNGNTEGVEVIAKDDSDVTPAQVASGKAFAAAMAKQYPGLQVFGHGEVNPSHKMASEGHSIVAAYRDLAGQPKLDPNYKPAPVPLQQRTLAGYMGRDLPVDPAGEAHQHIANLKLVLATQQHRAFPWQHHDFKAAVQAAQSAAGIERAREEGRRQADQPRRHMGLSDDRYQRPDKGKTIHVTNASGSNIHTTLIASAFG